MRRRLVFSALVVTSAGCTLLSGVADLEATRDGTDARVQPGPDGSPSIPVEASSNDAISPPVDAGPDAVVNFCDGVTAPVCFDYDSKSIDPSADPSHVNSTLSVDGPGHDSNNALHCVGQDELGAQCFHLVTLPPAPNVVHYRFDVLVESPGQAIEMTEIEFTYATGRCTLQPAFVDTAVQVNEFCPDQGSPDQINHDVATLDSTTASVWYTFDITLDLANHTFKGSFAKPGNTTAFGPITLDPRFLTSPAVALHPGMSFGAKATPAPRIRIDNVLLDFP